MIFINKIIFGLYHRLLSAHSSFRVAYFIYLWKNQLSIGLNFQFDRTSSIDMQSGDAQLVVYNNVYFRKYCNIICSNNGLLTIGKNVFFNNYCSINCLQKISIGENSIFGEGIKIYDHNHRFINNDINIAEQGHSFGEINIGSNCWIGSNVIILKGVTIGDNVVIGANCLIYKSIPANMIVKNQSELIFDTI